VGRGVLALHRDRVRYGLSRQHPGADLYGPTRGWRGWLRRFEDISRLRGATGHALVIVHAFAERPGTGPSCLRAVKADSKSGKIRNALRVTTGIEAARFYPGRTTRWHPAQPTAVEAYLG